MRDPIAAAEQEVLAKIQHTVAARRRGHVIPLLPEARVDMADCGYRVMNDGSLRREIPKPKGKAEVKAAKARRAQQRAIEARVRKEAPRG